MKRKYIFVLVIAILFTTGCNCEYNLTINNNNYNEEIKIIADNETEVSQFNLEWIIPTNKEEYSMVGDPDSIPNYSNIYKYNVKDNTLIFSNNFEYNEYKKSTAVSVCFERFKVSPKDNTIIISTRSKIECFDKYDKLNSITINAKVDKEVIEHDADKVKGNIYTWYIDKSNLTTKSINLVLQNDEEDSSKKIDIEIPNNDNNSSGNLTNSSQNSSSSNISNNTKNNNNDYTLYIFCGILLLVMLLAYFTFNKIKNKNNKMDD